MLADANVVGCSAPSTRRGISIASRLIRAASEDSPSRLIRPASYESVHARRHFQRLAADPRCLRDLAQFLENRDKVAG